MRACKARRRKLNATFLIRTPGRGARAGLSFRSNATFLDAGCHDPCPVRSDLLANLLSGTDRVLLSSVFHPCIQGTLYVDGRTLKRCMRQLSRNLGHSPAHNVPLE